VKILRDAYIAAFKDADFVAGVEKIQQEPADVIPGDKLQEMVETSLAEFKAELPEYKALQKKIFERYVKGL
jgi:uncharacterized membrane protein YgcG